MHVEHGLGGRGDPRVAGRPAKGRREVHGPCQDDLREQRSCRAQVRQMQADIERLGDGHQRNAAPPELLPGGDARDVHIEQLADPGAGEVRGPAAGSPDIGAVTGQHPVLKGGDLRRSLRLTRHLDRDGLVREVQELEQAPPDRRHLQGDRCRGRRRSFGEDDEEVPAELVVRQDIGVAVIDLDRQHLRHQRAACRRRWHADLRPYALIIAAPDPPSGARRRLMPGRT